MMELNTILKEGSPKEGLPSSHSFGPKLRMKTERPLYLISTVLPWERPEPVESNKHSSLIYFVRANRKVSVKVSDNLYRSFCKGQDAGTLLGVMPGGTKLRNQICKRFGAEKGTSGLRETKALREYIDDLCLMYPEVNAECNPQWTDELLKKMEEPTSLYGLSVYLVMRMGDDVIVYSYSFAYLCSKEGFPGLGAYDLADRSAPLTLLAVRFTNGHGMGYDDEFHRLMTNTDTPFHSDFDNLPVYQYSQVIEDAVADLNRQSPISDYMQRWFNYHAKAGLWDCPSKLCKIPECDWHADNNNLGYCSGHFGQHRKVERQKRGNGNLRLVEHMYLLRPWADGDSPRKFCKARYEVNGRKLLCAKPRWSADDLCAGHKRELLNGMSFSPSPTLDGTGGLHRSKGIRVFIDKDGNFKTPKERWDEQRKQHNASSVYGTPVP